MILGGLEWKKSVQCENFLIISIFTALLLISCILHLNTDVHLIDNL